MVRIFTWMMLLACASAAEAFSLATWNVAEGSIEQVTRREEDIARLGKAMRSNLKGQLPAVVVLQEITSYAAAVRVARALGYENGTVATSDSGNDREIWPFALEIAIVTTKPVISVTSYQSRADAKYSPFIAAIETGNVSFGTVKHTVVPSQVALPENEFIPRAILRVELEGGIVIYGVHLNSSGLGFCRLDDAMKGGNELRKRAVDLGLTREAEAVQNTMDRVRAEMGRARNPGIEATKQEALRRARTREAAAGAIALLAASDRQAGKHVFAAGDFNTPLEETCKTGKNLKEDFEPMMGCATRIEPTQCGAQDGFDDTYAILTAGLINDTRLRVLTKGLGRTYLKGNYVDSPIDNVLTSIERPFRALKLLESGHVLAFGSDHAPVLVFEGTTD